MTSFMKQPHIYTWPTGSTNIVMLLLIVVGMKYNQTFFKNTHEWEYVCVSINKSALYVLEKLFYLQIWTVKHNNSIHEQPRPIHNDAFAAGIHQCEIKNL